MLRRISGRYSARGEDVPRDSISSGRARYARYAANQEISAPISPKIPKSTRRVTITFMNTPW